MGFDDDLDDEAELDEREMPDPSDVDDDDTDDAVRCATCGRAVYDEGGMCPHCGGSVDAPSAVGRYKIWFLLGVAAAAAVIVWLSLH